jgi:hydroxyacylglutathione hydrolase
MTAPSSKLRVETLVEPMFGENGFVLSVRDGGPCWIIDPGLPPQCEEILAFIKKHRLTVAAVVLTHGHADHIAGLDHILHDWPDAQVMIGREDDLMLTNANANLSAAFGVGLVAPRGADAFLDPGAKLELDGLAWEVLDTSGHTAGGRSFYCPAAGVVITGDALFAGSIGRTDFPGGSERLLIRNIRERLLTLPDKTVVYSGHGPTTTIGQEKRTNPFVGDD